MTTTEEPTVTIIIRDVPLSEAHAWAVNGGRDYPSRLETAALVAVAQYEGGHAPDADNVTR